MEDANDGVRLLLTEDEEEALALARQLDIGNRERKRLEKDIEQLGLKDRFILLGAVDNPYPYIKQADLFMQVTRFEGKSIAVEEAQALGKAIVATDCTGNREQIINEKDGLLIPLDAQSIAQAAKRLLTDDALRDTLAKASSIKRSAHSGDLSVFLGEEEAS